MFFRRRSSISPAGAPGLLSAARTDDPAGSVIGRSTRFRGEIRGEGCLRIRGHVEGFVRIQGRVLADAGSFIHGDVFVPEMVVAGTAEGELRIPRVLLVRSSGRVRGELASGTLLVEEGAVVLGTVHRMTADQAPEPQSTP